MSVILDSSILTPSDSEGSKPFEYSVEYLSLELGTKRVRLKPFFDPGWVLFFELV
jgi:hypothetical protein